MYLHFFSKVRESSSQDQLIKAILNLKISAGEASSKAPLGPTLGQYGIQIAEFCTLFNKMTEEYALGAVLTTKIILYGDMGYDVFITGIDIPTFLKKILNISKFSPIGKKALISNSIPITKAVTTVALYELVNFKLSVEGATHISIKNYYKNVCAFSRSVGLLIIPKKALMFLSKYHKN